MADRLVIDRLRVGYFGKSLIRDISFSVRKGEIVTLIGPNGAGKSTILKTITRQLAPIAGAVFLEQLDLRSMSYRQLAQKLSVVLTERVKPELMTCYEVVAAGRYPYTGRFGALMPHDREVIAQSLAWVQAQDIAQQDFMCISDGQRQRILLARALCQEPEILVLDEPTSFLDVRYKLELLNILTLLAREKGLAILLSLHEIELAAKVSDRVICVKGDRIARIGKPEEVFTAQGIAALYDLECGSYNELLGSVELGKPQGTPQIFVIGGNGCGIVHYRALQKRQIPFAAGILFENDVDAQVARVLSDQVVIVPAFQPMDEAHFAQAASLMTACSMVIDAGAPMGTLNAMNGRLLELANARHIPVRTNLE